MEKPSIYAIAWSHVTSGASIICRRKSSSDSPPTLLLHGENDTLVWFRHSVRLEARLEHAGVRCVLVGLPWATHAFEFNLSGPGGQLTTYALERFLAAVVK